MPASDPLARPDLGPLLVAQTRRRIVDTAVRNSVARQFSEELHPRVPAGSAGGGQFGAAKGAKKTPAKTRSGDKQPAGEQETTVRQPRTRRKVVIPKGSFGYDPASNHGTGYGSKNGDPHVHDLQKALNRLGFTDSRGRKLTDDGKLGPLTTAAVRKAQRALGMKADGIVSPAFLKQLVALKTAPKPRARKAATAQRRAEIVAEVARKFDPMQKRDPDGTWGDGIPGSAVIGDVLKIAESIPLDKGETFVGSSRVSLPHADVRMALTRAADGSPSLRFGVDSELPGKWRGMNGGYTVKLDREGIDALAAKTDELAKATKKAERDADRMYAHIEDVAQDVGADLSKPRQIGEAHYGDPELDRLINEYDAFVDEGLIDEGSFDTPWGQLYYRAVMTDTGADTYLLVTKPGADLTGADALEDRRGYADPARLDPDDMRKLASALGKARDAAAASSPTSKRGGAWAMTRATARSREDVREPEAEEPAVPPAQIPMTYQRVFPLEGIEILSRAKGGDGRTVEAYAAVFGVKTEVHDQHGDYIEENHPTVFNRTISNGAAKRALVLYNHGYDARGKSGGLPTVPIGHPVEIKADKRGLLTVSRYNDSEFTDSVLAAIKNGDIKAQSYEGPIYKSSPMRVPKVARGAQLPLVTRMEMGLRNYGPTPTPYYPQAEITAVRSAAQLAEEFARLDEAEREELIRALSTTPGWDPETAHILATPHRGPGAEDSRNAYSVRQKKIRLRAELLDRTL